MYIYTQRKKGLDAISGYISDQTIQTKIDAKTDSSSKQFSWNLLLGRVHDTIVSNVSRLKPTDLTKKAKG